MTQTRRTIPSPARTISYVLLKGPKGQKIDRKMENGMANRFEIRQTKNGSFRFNLIATNG